MQFTTVAFFAAAAIAATVTETESSETLVTITSCADTVTDCPAKQTSASAAPSNGTHPVVTSYEGAANSKFAAAGAAALAAGAFMKLSDESKSFHHSVYMVVAQVPQGHVTSYGHIAYLLNRPQNSRQVGFSLKHCEVIIGVLSQDGPLPYSMDTLPWWRVLSSSGSISPRATSGEYLQATKLATENVVVSGKHKVDLEQYGWFPDDVDY